MFSEKDFERLWFLYKTEITLLARCHLELLDTANFL